MIRTLRSDLESKVGRKLSLGMAILPWLVRHAAYLITRCRVRAHGKTALQLMKGRTSLAELVPFGETIWFKIPKTGNAVGSFEDRWEQGVWIGSTIRDGMSLIGTPSGVFKVGTIKRKPDGEQWSHDNLERMAGSPQQPQPGIENRRITTFAKKKLEERDRARPEYQPPVPAPYQPRNVRIQKPDIDKYGVTEGCAACRAIAAGKPWRTSHSVECRTRIEKAMLEDPEDLTALTRQRIASLITSLTPSSRRRRKGSGSGCDPCGEDPHKPKWRPMLLQKSRQPSRRRGSTRPSENHSEQEKQNVYNQPQIKMRHRTKGELQMRVRRQGTRVNRWSRD